MAVMISLAVLIAAGMLLFIPTLMSINTRYELATKQVEQFRASGAVVSPSDVSNLQARTTVLVEKFATPVVQAPATYVALVRSVLTTGITLTGFVMQQGDTPTMQITGTSLSREGVQRFVEMLRSTKGITNVDSPLSNLVKSRDVQFVITVTFTK